MCLSVYLMCWQPQTLCSCDENVRSGLQILKQIRRNYRIKAASITLSENTGPDRIHVIARQHLLVTVHA